MENAIREDIRTTQPLVGPRINPSTLKDDYLDNIKAGFIPGIECLSKRYGYLRQVRGDGNCFYRAFMFSLLENLLVKLKSEDHSQIEAAKEQIGKLLEIVGFCKDMLIHFGYEELAFDMFYTAFVESLTSLDESNQEILNQQFNEEGGNGECAIWFCRLLTSLFVKTHAERFIPFLGIGDTIESFCAREIEPIGVECEQLQIIALAEQLNVGIKIEYLDGEKFDQSKGLNAVDVCIVEGSNPDVILLFRPGHYDILYST